MFEQVVVALDQVETLVNRGFSHIKSRCSENGKLMTSQLDKHQLASYELAYCAAELAASKQFIQYAQQLRATKGATQQPLLEEKQALYFSAEVIRNIQNRLTLRPADFGLQQADLTTFNEPMINEFCQAQLSSDNLTAMGETLKTLDGKTGESLLGEEKEMMRETFRSVAEDVVIPLAEDIHRKDLLIPDAILQPLKELGCFGLSIPMQYGGIQPDGQEDNLGMIVVTEELSRGSLGGAGSLITRPEILSRTLMKGGTEAQREYWLPKLAIGEPLCAVAVTEPNYGSDVASMRLKATQVEGGWVLNGAKTWCTMGGKAEVLLTLARTNPDLSLNHKGLSLFLVEKPPFDGHEFSVEQSEGSHQGTLTGKAISTIGYRGMHSFDLFFDNYFVPDSHVVGEEEGVGKGFYYTMAGFAGGRIQTAARATGVMQAAYEKGLQYALDRQVFNKPIADYSLTLYKLARMATLLNACRQFTYAVGKMMDEGKGQMEASLVKLFSCKTSEWVCREAMQIHGGMGYAEESAVSRYFIDSRVLSIFEGAEETLALKVIAKALVEQAA